MGRVPEWLVTVRDFPPVRYSARTAGKARYLAFVDYTNAFEVTFRDFLNLARVERAASPPASDGYDNVRRQYPNCYSPQIGERVTGEGITGTVIYPGESTCYVHVLPDGRNHHVVMHPAYVSPTPKAPS